MRRSFLLPGSDAGRLAGGLIGIGFILTLVAGILFYTFGQVVPPGYFGVRQVTVGPGQGFSARGLSPGLHVTVPFFVNVHLVPRTVQVLNFHRANPDGSAGVQLPAGVDPISFSSASIDTGGLEVRTSDGLSVDLDVSILTRFYDRPSASTNDSEGESRRGADRGEHEAHGGPASLFTRVGTSPELWDQEIRKVAADELRRSLGALVATEFYESPAKRATAIDRAEREMRRRLDPLGIRVEAVLLRRYTYKDSGFDEAISEKNIQEQEQRLKDAAGKFAEVMAQLEQVAAEWDANVETLRIQGENKAHIIRSEAALYENERKAEGDLSVARAQADVDRLKAGALATSEGSGIYIAREMAPLLSSLRGGVVSNIDPYDIGEWAKRLGVSGAGTAPGSSVKAVEPSAASSAARVAQNARSAPSAASLTVIPSVARGGTSETAVTAGGAGNSGAQVAGSGLETTQAP